MGSRNEFLTSITDRSEQEQGPLTVGLFGGSFKPFHRGHYRTILEVSSRVDILGLFVSTADRRRRGEFPVSWQTMETLWSKWILPILPVNVQVLPVRNPLSGIYSCVDPLVPIANVRVLLFYGDEDRDRFSNHNRGTYFRKLGDRFSAKQVARTTDGRTARAMLASGDYDGFVRQLPPPLRTPALAAAVWNKLLIDASSSRE
jgi:hypothetical protein